MFVEIIALTPTVSVIEIILIMITIVGFTITLKNLQKEIRARSLLVAHGKDTHDNMEAANENIRRQNYRTTKQGTMLILLAFLCTQMQPIMYTLAGFVIHLVLLYNVIVSTMDSFYDSKYQKKFREQVNGTE